MKSPLHLTLALLLMVILSSCTAAATPTAPAEFRIPPYLVFTGKGESMTVMWQADHSPNRALIEWGADETYTGGKAEIKDPGGAQGDHMLSYTIQGITPGTRTFYRVTMDGQVRASSFLTAPENPNQFSLYAVSDTQTNPAIQNRLMAGILEDIRQQPEARQTILLHGGDHVSHGLYESDWIIEYFNAYYKNISSALASLPVVGVLSNHHLYEAKEYVKVCAKPYAKTYRKFFPYPFYANPEHFYYSIDYGSVHITMIDPYTAEFQPGSPQYAWLQSDLAKPAAFKFVVMHQTAWAYRLGALALRQHLHPLFKSSGVQVVLQGHEHYYNRLVVDGIQYVTMGGGGGALTYPGSLQLTYANPEDYLVMSTCVNVPFDSKPDVPQVNLVDPQKAFRANHYLRLDWNGQRMSIRAVDVEGKLLDCFPEGAVCEP